MKLIGLIAVAVLTASIVLIAYFANADKHSSCHPDFKTKTIYLDSLDNPTFWTIQTAQGEWGCKKKVRRK